MTSVSAGEMIQPGLTYVLRNAVYVALTNRALSVTLIESRGP